jgi:glycerol kinase
VAGGAIRWLRDNLGIAPTFEEVDELATQCEDNGGVYFVPAFGGLLAPYWRPDARGIICGLTEHSTKSHLARAAYEAVTFQVRDLLEAMRAEGGATLSALRVDGGMTTNAMLMQLQADILGIPTIRPEMSETTALGAAMAAGAGAGIWELGQGEAGEIVTEEWEGRLGEEDRQLQYAKWKEAVKRACGWAVPPSTLTTPPGIGEVGEI